MNRVTWFKRAAWLAAIAVIVLALAAHWLESRLPVHRIKSIETAAQIQFLHALAILILSFPHEGLMGKSRNRILQMMAAGVLLFSGSIYLLSLRELAEMDWLRFLWPITPLGGILLIVSWIFLAFEKR